MQSFHPYLPGYPAPDDQHQLARGIQLGTYTRLGKQALEQQQPIPTSTLLPSAHSRPPSPVVSCRTTRLSLARIPMPLSLPALHDYTLCASSAILTEPGATLGGQPPLPTRYPLPKPKQHFEYRILATPTTCRLLPSGRKGPPPRRIVRTRLRPPALTSP